ncbi:hypothetical protein [Nocardia cyriacigeorgica]|uniref:hypothetical protein n=1 Tax=Nocardia cyriacigeorgica TaxID=135487 RepID=UPI002455DB78|nr:hypothetical protein [Nocardia cyriacigeorgica]
MVNYRAEMDRIIEEAKWQSARLQDDLAEINQRTAAKGQESADRYAVEMRQFWEEAAVELEKLEAEYEKNREAAEVEAEKERLAAEERERLEAEAREQREAIARSMQARRSKDVVAPIDEDDEEAQYYQRKSWLV